MTKLCSTPAGAVLVAIDMSKNRQEASSSDRKAVGADV